MFVLVVAILIVLIFSGLYFFQEKVIFLPESLHEDYQFSFDDVFEEWHVPVGDGVSINALHFKTDNPKGVVFYSHGNAGSLRTWGGVAAIFLKYDYDVLIYDYRSYGKSGGKVSEEALYHDARILYEKLCQLYDESQIIIYGRSIGTGVATEIASNGQPKHLILESPYYSLPDLATHILPVVPRFLVRFQFRNDQKIGKVACPVTIMHGTSDEVIYFESSVKLEKLLKSGDQMVPINGGHHNDLAAFEAYHKQIERILSN